MTTHVRRARRDEPRPSLHLTSRRRRLPRALSGAALLVTSVAGMTWGAVGASAQTPTELPFTQEGWAWQANDPTGPVESELPGGLPDVEAPAPQVAAGTLPVGMAGGRSQYMSYIQWGSFRFSPTNVPEGATVTSFVITLTEAGVNGGTTTGVEACANTELFAAGGNQSYAQAPATNCAFSATGVKDGATWTFDMTGAARAWAAGTLGNNGITLAPIPPPNLPVGQQPLSWQTSFAGGDAAKAVIQFTLPLPSPSAPPTASSTPTTGPTGGGSPTPSSGPSSGGGGPTSSPSPASSPTPTSGYTPPASTYTPPPSSGGTTGGSSGYTPPRIGGSGFSLPPPIGSQPAPGGEAAPAAPVDAPVVAPPAAGVVTQPGPQTGGAVAVGAVPATTPAGGAGFVWFLAPIGLAGMYLLAQSLTNEAELVVAREGAVSRLIARREAERQGLATSSPVQV